MNNKLIRINLILVVTLGTLVTYLNSNFQLDDALIYYRYIENFIQGNGLVYNIGEKFNALTSPLYIYLSVIISSITREVEITQVVLNGILLTASSVTIVYIFRDMKLYYVGFIASLLLITAKYFYLVFGMETNLFIFLSIVSIYFYLNNKLLLFSIASSLLLTTRGEGIFLVIILTSLIIKENRKDLKIVYLIPLLIILAINLGINHFYYGQLFPHTLTAKIAQGQSGLWGSYSFLMGADYLFNMFNNQALFIFFIISFSIIGIAVSNKNKVVIILCINSFLLMLFYTALNIPNYHWYYAPVFLTFYILVAFGSVKIFQFIKFRGFIPIVRSIALVLIFVYCILTHLETARTLVNEKPKGDYKYLGDWLKNNTPADSKIAAIEIGHVGWYSKRYIIDILGLTNPLNAEFIGKQQFDKWFEYYKPDYIIVHEPFWPGHEQSIPRLVEKGYFKEDSLFYLKGIKLLKSTGKKD